MFPNGLFCFCSTLNCRCFEDIDAEFGFQFAEHTFPQDPRLQGAQNETQVN